jgi:hypothetical protein
MLLQTLPHLLLDKHHTPKRTNIRALPHQRLQGPAPLALVALLHADYHHRQPSLSSGIPLLPGSHSFRDPTPSEISYSNNNLRELYLTSSLEPGFTWLPLMPWNVMQLLGVSNFGQGVLLAQGATEWASMATLGGSDARTAEMPRRTIMAVRCTVECGIG